MNNKNIALALCSVFALGFLSLAPAEAKKWTVTKRQEKLCCEIDQARKSNQLTSQEADNLKAEVDRVKEKEQKMKDKNAGELSYSDNTELERDLNKVSNKLHKKTLEKRVE